MAARNEAAIEDEPIQFRIGINSGDVIVEDGDIHGDGVNIAARLEGIAEPGVICVAQGVRDPVRERLGFTFEDIGEQALKNIAAPVHAFRVRFEGPEPAEREGIRPARLWYRPAAWIGASAAIAALNRSASGRSVRSRQPLLSFR